MASNTICEPCNRKETTSVAVSWCSDCEEALCLDCVDAHRVIKVSSAHHVVDLEHALSIPGVIPTSQQFCEDHSELVIELFCTFHDVLCCRGCMTEFHRNCEKLVPIDLASKNIKQSTMLSDLGAELDNIIHSSKQIADIRKNHNDSIIEQQKGLVQKVAKAKSDVIEFVENLERKLLDDLNNLCTVQKRELQSEQRTMMGVHKSATELQDQINFVRSNGSSKQAFLLLHKIKTDIANMDHQLEKTIKTLEQPVIQFKESNKGFTFMEELGNINVRKDSCSVLYSSPKLRFAQVLPDQSNTISSLEFENKFDVETSPQMQITGMLALPDGKLLLCNYRNNSILAYDSSGTYVSSCPLSGAPFGISNVPNDNSHAVTTMPQGSSIRFINIPNLKPGKAVEMPGNCYGITCTIDKIIVGGIQEIYFLNANGSHLSTVRVNKTTRLWFMCVLNDKIYYSDQNKVYCVNQNGDEIFVYSAPSLSRPMGIAVDSKNNFYISGCNTNNIHRISSKGLFIDTVLGRTGIRNPWAMCYDRHSGKLVFANNEGRTICIFKCT